MKTLHLLIVTLALTMGASFAAEAGKPNVVLFLIDDQDKNQIGAFGGKAFTPNLDRMAAEGMKFTRAYVSSAVCTPSRYGWVTGRYAGNSTSKLYGDACGGAGRQGNPNFNMALEPDRMNLGNVLREAGYATGWVGKFHLDSKLDFPQFYTGKDGFKRVPDDASPGAKTSALFAHNELVMRRYITNLGFSWVKHVYHGNLEKPYNQHNPEWTTAAALEFIEENKTRPFYLHLCSTLLHGGAGSSRKSWDHPLVSGQGELKEAPQGMTPRSVLEKKLAAAGFRNDSKKLGEAWIDDALGAVLRKLRECGLDDNTLVVFAPDHGRDGKSSLFTQDGVGIPMIARWPGRIPAGVNCDELVQNVDWTPTVLELAGVKKPDGYRVDGVSHAPWLLGQNTIPVRDHVYIEMGCARGVATKDWKYIAVRYPQAQVELIKQAKIENLPRLMSYIGRLGIGTRGAEHAGFWDADQLYDLRADPGEQTNLANDPRHAEVLSQMKALLTTELKTGGRPFGEFIPGGNAAPDGLVDKQITLVKQLEIQGKRVVVPKQSAPVVPDMPSSESRREKRMKRKAIQ